MSPFYDHGNPEHRKVAFSDAVWVAIAEEMESRHHTDGTMFSDKHLAEWNHRFQEYFESKQLPVCFASIEVDLEPQTRRTP